MATSTTARKRSAPAAAAAPEEAPARRQRKSSAIKRLLRTLLLVLIVIAASVGATLYYTWPSGTPLLGFLDKETATEDVDGTSDQAPAKPTPPPVAVKPIFSPLDPFTVTINTGGSRSRVLHVAITLQVEDENSGALLHEYMPVVRDRVLKVLSRQDPAYVQSPEGREQLVDALADALSASYGPGPTVPRIANVLFTAFVVQ